MAVATSLRAWYGNPDGKLWVNGWACWVSGGKETFSSKDPQMAISRALFSNTIQVLQVIILPHPGEGVEEGISFLAAFRYWRFQGVCGTHWLAEVQTPFLQALRLPLAPVPHSPPIIPNTSWHPFSCPFIICLCLCGFVSGKYMWII